MSLELLDEPRTELDAETEDPQYAHVVDRGDDPRPATAIVLEAMVNGTPVTALCGFVFVPSRNPTPLQPCPKCMEILPFVIDFRGYSDE